MADSTSTKPVGGPGLSNMYSDARNPPKEPTSSFKGKTVLIIGATAGVGYDAAIKFARLGAARIVIGARNAETASAAKARIVDASGLSAAAIDIFNVDFESFQSVADFAAAVDRNVGHVHVLLVNAGIAAPHFRLTKDGWESTLQVNVLSTALCAIRLLPKLEATAASTGQPPVLEITGSEAHLSVKDSALETGTATILEHYNKPDKFNAAGQYCISKLLVMFIQQGIVAALKGKPTAPTVLVCSPGMTRTSIGRNFGLAIRALMGVMQTFIARSSEEGSRTLVSGASLGSEANGRFWMNDQFEYRAPELSPEAWKELQPTAFKCILDVLETRCPGTMAILGL